MASVPIDGDLANAARLLARHDREWPDSPDSTVREFIERHRHRPAKDALYPGLAAAADAQAWLTPLLDRLGEASPEETVLIEMLEFAMDRVKRITEAEFIALTNLLERRRLRFLRRMPALAHPLQQRSLSEPLRDAMTRLHAIAATPQCPTGGLRLWPLLAQHPDVCWSAHFRHGVASMNPGLREAWERVANGSNAQLDVQHLETGLRCWVSALRPQPLVLTAVGGALLQHIIARCTELDCDTRDELLYGIACAPWNTATVLNWIPAYLEALRPASHDRAFACVEALMMNPVTALESVRTHYDALLAIFATIEQPNELVGADGFPLESEPALIAEHARIDQLLQLAHMPLAAAEHAMEAAMLADFAADPAALYRAATCRLEWIGAHRQEYAPAVFGVWRQWLGGLAPRALVKVREASLDSLLYILPRCRGNVHALDLTGRYIARHGWHTSLLQPLRQWIARSRGVDRERAAWLLWSEPFTPIEMGTCWSQRIRRDLRRMPAGEAAAWHALLGKMTFTAASTPSRPWLKDAASALAGVSPAAFRNRMVEWFAPFAENTPLRLTTTGRNVLRLLLWYATLAQDPQVERAVLALPGASWATPESSRRALHAAKALAYVTRAA